MKNVLNIIKKNIVLSITVAGIAIAVTFFFAGQKIANSIGELSREKAAEIAVEYVNKNLLMSGLTASLVESSDENSVYKIRLAIKEDEVDLGELDSYVSKDGEIFFPEGYYTKENIDYEEPQGEEPQAPLSPEQALEFVSCLKEAGFVIYGSNQCGWTTQLVEMLGGWETVVPIYIECTEETELCQEKEIIGYPTILINGQEFQGSRTFKDFSEFTGCPLPENGENIGDTTVPAGDCQ